MTDHYDEMRVSPDPLLAEELRSRLHAHIASASSDRDERRSDLQLDVARLEPDAHLVPVKEIFGPRYSPTSETRNRRRLAIAAAAVVVVVGVAAISITSMQLHHGPGVGAPVDPRREAAEFIDGVDVTYIVPDGWKNIRYGVVKGDPGFGVIFGNLDDIYFTRFCRLVSVGPAVGPTVDDLVSAWTNLPGVDATAARDVTIDGFDGKQFEFTVPDYSERDCNGIFSRCSFAGEPPRPRRCDTLLGYTAFPSGGSHMALPTQHQKVIILDVDGSRLVIMAGSFPNTSPQDRAALDEIVASIQFGAPVAPSTVAATTGRSLNPNSSAVQ